MIHGDDTGAISVVIFGSRGCARQEPVASAAEGEACEGVVRRDVDAKAVASFVVAAAEGSYGLAKGAQSLPMLRSNLEMLGRFLESLRPAPE